MHIFYILRLVHATPCALRGIALVAAKRQVVVGAVDGLVPLKCDVVRAVIHVFHVARGRRDARAVIGGLHVPGKHLPGTHGRTAHHALHLVRTARHVILSS